MGGGGLLPGGGGGGNFHYKGIYRRAAGIGHTFQAIQYMNGHHFHFKSIINLVSFLLKKYMNRWHVKNSIWIGTIFTMQYGKYKESIFHFALMYMNWDGSAGLKPHVRTQNHGK